MAEIAFSVVVRLLLLVSSSVLQLASCQVCPDAGESMTNAECILANLVYTFELARSRHLGVIAPVIGLSNVFFCTYE